MYVRKSNTKVTRYEIEVTAPETFTAKRIASKERGASCILTFKLLDKNTTILIYFERIVIWWV